MRGDWLRLHYHAPKSPKVMALPSDAARWAWIVALCEAKQQTREGGWASEAHLRSVLGRHARHLPALIEARLVVQMDDGRMLIRDWTEWQSDYRSDPTHAERQRRYRERATSQEDVSVTSPPTRRTDRRTPPRVFAHEEPTTTPPPMWQPKDEKHLNSRDIPVRDAARKAAEAAGIDWRALVKAKGEEPNE